ncbi:hypothetical protein ANTPLA_LOCUS1192 [Anthophora plagiata]
MSQSEDAYAPEEPTPDIPISLLDIQMPETPESTRGQASDGDTPRLESPKMLKPVLGKVQAKKRLMAFANKFNVLPKVQNKSNLLQAHSAKISKSKTVSGDNSKSLQNDSSTAGLSIDSDSMQFHNRHSSGGKSKKKTEEKILAIEEIRREESKSKMLLAEAMAAASLEEETYSNRNGQNLLENVKMIRERNRQDDISVSHKNASKSSIESKYSERRRYGREERRDSVSRESKDYNGSKERYYKISHDKEQRRKDKDKKDDRDKRDDSNKYEESRDRRDEERERKDNERDKWEEVREKKGAKEKRESFREKQSDSQERTAEIKDKREKEKDKDKGKERDITSSSSWMELKKCGITMDDIIDIRRRDYSERSTKNRTAEDYLRHFEQMLMLNDFRSKRYAFVAEGLDGPKEYPPESIRITKRGRPQLFYSENPRMSLFIDHQHILQTVTTDHREKMREICETDFIRDNPEEAEKPQRIRNWYPKTGICKLAKNAKWHAPISIQLPKSKWDSEDEDRLSNDTEKEEEENKVESSNIPSEREPEAFSPRLSTMEKDISNDKKMIKEDETPAANKADDNRQSTSPLQQSAGNEKLASEYEQFMKMVCSDIPISKEFSPKPAKSSVSTLSYHEFNIETNLPEDNNFSFVEHSISGKSDKSDSSKADDKFKSNESRQNLEKHSKIEEDQISSSSSQIQIQECVRVESKDVHDKSESEEDSKSIPSDWENVRIKVERLSDENSDSRETRKKKRRKKMTSSSSESSSSSSSSDTDEEVKRKKRKRKSSNDSDSPSDSDSSDSSSSSSDSSSSDDKRKKRRKKKRKAEKKKKKAKRIARIKKKRRRKVSSDSSSSDSSDDKRKKRAASKKSKQKKVYSDKEENNEELVKVIQKSPLECSPENAKLIRSQVPLKKIKEEAKAESRKKSEKRDIWNKEQELVRKVMSDGSACNKAHKDDEKNKSDERYLEEWEMDSVIMSQKGEKKSTEKIDNVEVESIRKADRKDERGKKDDRMKKDERFKEKCPSIGKEILQGGLKMEEDSDGKKRRKRDKEKKNSNEFLADWEKESERISQQIMQDEMKFSKKLDKQKKEKWGETEFDTLNVPSLTQLEREVSKRQLLADEWEVDSLEAVPDLMINKKKAQKISKKLEKEVRYDKKTDTYIAIEKGTLRECKKRQDRLSAMRIWEEEQEEGEKEAMMLMEQKTKRKKDEWEIEEDTYLREKSERKKSMEDSIPTIDSIHKEVSSAGKDVDASMKHDVVATKKSKKSRWDIASQAEEKLELKAPVMWEEECAEWTKVNKFERKIDKASLECCDTILPKAKIKDEDVCMVEQQSRKSTSKSSDITDLFPRKSQDVDLIVSSWTPEEHLRSKLRMKSLENSSQRDTFFEKTKEVTPTKEHTLEQLTDIFEIDVKLQKNVELYSPSSPAASQKSEDMETFNDNRISSSNLKDDLSPDKPKKETLIKSDEESVPNIPLQIKYRDGKYAKPTVTKEEFDDILGVQAAEEQTVQKKFDAKSSENSMDLPINEPCPDPNYKPLRMDIFAEYESDESRGKLSNKSSEAAPFVKAKEGEEINEGKAALKLIPKQLLIRRNNERVKTKLISDDPIQHAAALLTIQKKLRESHAVRTDIKSTCTGESSTEFKIECEKITNRDAPIADVVPTEQTTITDVKVDSKDLSITVKTSITTKSESPGSVKLDFDRIEEYKSGDKVSKVEELKKPKASVHKDVSDTEVQLRSPGKEQKKKSPSRKESREDKRMGDRGKEKRDKKYDDRERGDRRDNRSSKQDYIENRRRSSPSGSRSKRKRSTSWEREGSHSESHSRSWSRSKSKSPKRKDELLIASSSREKRSSRMDDDRSNRSRMDDKRERRSSPRFNTASYGKDHFKKHGSAKGDRDEWSRRKYDCMEREKEGRSYEQTDVLRERNTDTDRHREGRFRGDDADRSLWPYESENILRDGNESLDSYLNGQDLDLDYEEKVYYRDDSMERDIMEGSLRLSSKFKHRKGRSSTRRDRQWEKERAPLDLDRHGHLRRTDKLLPSRSRSPLRLRRSPPRISHDRFRRGSRSRSKSWSRSRSRSRSRTRSRSGSRSRTRSTSGSRMRSPDHLRMAERLRSSRSPSVGRGRINESSRERKDEHDNMKLDSCGERGRRIETIVQSVTGLPRDTSVLDSEMHIGDSMETVATSFQYSAENEVGNEYYYTENNLTYPPCIDDTAASSPKRLSLDDRLELELGIKKQQDATGMSNDYGDNFNSNICYPSPPQQQQMLYRQQPTVLQVGNVLQVVPADFNGVPATRREPTNTSTTPIVRGSSQVVRVGNVLQVVPTSLDWSGGQPSSVEQSATGMMYSAPVPQPSPVPAAPISVPVPVPVPMPVPVPPAMSTPTPVTTLSPVPLPLSVPVPVPGPVPLPVTQTTFPRAEVTPQKVPVQPVYNYEAILETRRKEQEERKRVREIRRKEKERRRIERINRRALRLFEKNNLRQSENASQQQTPSLDPSVLKALRESEEQVDTEEQQSSTAVPEKEEEAPAVASSASAEEEEAPVEEDEEEEEEEEPEVEDDEEDEEEAEEDEEEEEEDDEKTKANKLKNEMDEAIAAIATTSETNKIPVETESKEWPELPPPPLKGILVASGFRRTTVPNGNLDDLSTPENESGDNTDKEGPEVDKNEFNKEEISENRSCKSKIHSKKSKSVKLSKRKQRNKKSVQFADGIKPGEGTSPSGGEGDMPSPPPPSSVIARSGIRDIRRSSSRKSRKQEKRTRPPKAKKKVKVKIIKLKKPRVTPLTAMMMDDSDELDDRSPPPPPPGSPPPPHLWPSYLSAYNATTRTNEAQSTSTVSNTVQAPPPPTPLPLLVPPPPLNYTIQPCSKA